MPVQKTEKIWHNGKLINWDEATVHVSAHVISYGSALFEGIRCYSTPAGPAIFRARKHAERLLELAEVFGFRSLPWTAKELVAAFCDTVRANGFGECYIRPLIYLTDGGWNFNVDGGKPLT